MAKRSVKDKTKFLARLVTENKAPCAFCGRNVDDEIIFGKLYSIGDIQCHYFCVLLSCCLIQKGRDEEGLFGFLYPDIIAEIERSKKHKCSYCGKDGATLGCAVSQCRKQFHLPCGRERNAVSLFYGNYKSFCQIHVPKQFVTEIVMSKAKVRMQEKRRAQRASRTKMELTTATKTGNEPETLAAELVCVICYEEVDAFPTVQTFWPPCCARDAWFHRSCLQRMALSAGMHYLKCPLCNDKKNFYQAVLDQGYYVPDRDAAWELEQNAFAEIYERLLSCSVKDCKCPLGRNHDSDSGQWDIKLCLLCGSVGAHAYCLKPNYKLNIQNKNKTLHTDLLNESKIDAICLNEQDINDCQENIVNARKNIRNKRKSVGNSGDCSPNTKESAEFCVNDQDIIVCEENIVNTRNEGEIIRNSGESATNSCESIRNSRESCENIVNNKGPTGNSREVNVNSEELNENSKESTGNSREVNVNSEVFGGNIKKSNENSGDDDNIIRYICDDCRPAAPEDMDALLTALEEALISEQNAVNQTRSGPVMTSRMSLRRTKQRTQLVVPSSSYGLSTNYVKNELKEPQSKTELSRQELNITTPKRPRIKPESTNTNVLGNIQNILFSPIKMLEKSLKERSGLIGEKETERVLYDLKVVERLREKIRKPKPLSEKKKIIDEILDEILYKIEKEQSLIREIKKEACTPKKEYTSTDILIQNKTSPKTPRKEISQNKNDNSNPYRTPQKSVLLLYETPKTVDISNELSMEISENNDIVNVVTIQSCHDQDTKNSTIDTEKIIYKISPKDKETLESNKIDIDMESFKNRYLNEVDRDFQCNFKHKHNNVKAKPKLRTAIDFAIDAAVKENKRKRKMKMKNKKSKRKHSSKIVLKYDNGSPKKDEETSVSISNDDMKVKISLKKKKFRLKIQSKRERNSKNLKQYVLKSSPTTPNSIEKPEKEVCPLKRKYTKQGKSPDNYKQVSLLSYFQVQSPKD